MTCVTARPYWVQMPRRLGKWFVVVALVLATGSHWYLLQSIAWIGMAVEFSRTEPLPVALEKTFNGEHPCSLCKVVGEGMQAEKKSEMNKLQTKLEFVCGTSPVLDEIPTLFVRPLPQFPYCLERSETPPVPPPRAA